MLKRFQFVLACGLMVFAAVVHAAEKPNVVFILADDKCDYSACGRGKPLKNQRFQQDLCLCGIAGNSDELGSIAGN